MYKTSFLGIVMCVIHNRLSRFYSFHIIVATLLHLYAIRWHYLSVLNAHCTYILETKATQVTSMWCLVWNNEQSESTASNNSTAECIASVSQIYFVFIIQHSNINTGCWNYHHACSRAKIPRKHLQLWIRNFVVLSDVVMP